jgi:hypothetical protein
MTITNSSTRFIALLAGVAVAGALIAGAFAATPAQAQSGLSQTQINAIVSLLQSFGADSSTIANVQVALSGGTPSSGGNVGGTGGSSSCYAWTRDLTIGSTGADVMALQSFLNNSGNQVAVSGAGSAGNETMYFGSLTKGALASWQAAHGVAPAVGYFGPITRSAIAATCAPGTPGTPGTPSTPTDLQGGEGSLDIKGNLGDVETDIDEGDNDQNVLGADLEADDSDISIERVDVDVTISGTGSGLLTKYIDDVSLWLDGEKLAELDSDEGDEDTNNVFSYRFTGLNGVIREDDKGELYVRVSAVNNVDSGDVAKNLVFNIPQNGIRAVDGAGISETYVTSAQSTTLTSSSVNITEETAGDLDITEGDNNPEAQVVQIDADADTDDVLVLAFDLEADNQNLLVDDIPVGLVIAGEDAGVDGPVKRVTLHKDGSVVESKTITSTALLSQQIVFDDLDIVIEDGETAEFEVFVDLNDHDASTFATGTTLYATTTGSDAAWDVEDAAGDSVTPDGSVSNSGELLTFYIDGVSVSLVSASATRISVADASGENDVGEFKLVFDVTAIGSDIYLDRTVTDYDGANTAGDGFTWATTSDTSSTMATTSSNILSETISAGDTNSSDTTLIYKINEGQTRRFTLTVVVTAGGADGSVAIELNAVNWTQDVGDATPDNFYTSGLDDFRTDLLFLQNF